jgi:hypothetical protein
LAPARGQEAAVSPPPVNPVHIMVPGCDSALPLDQGQSFAGPRFLLWDDRLSFFEPTLPAQGGPPWRLARSERLPAAPPAAGLGRARVKWRDGALWMKVGTRVYQRDATSRQWFLMADPGLEFRDFEVDIKGRILLIATSDPASHRYRALLEAVSPDRRTSEILFEYPDQGDRNLLGRISPVAAATLLTGYESVQIQEFIVLFNPLARRLFVYQAINGNLHEATLGLPTRGLRELVTPEGAEPTSPLDLCWQVLPKSNAEAWVVVPASIGAHPAQTGQRDQGDLQAIALDLAEGRGDAPVTLPGCRLPLWLDPQGRLANLTDTLNQFARVEDPARKPAGH